jgi:hypothetical protein
MISVTQALSIIAQDLGPEGRVENAAERGTRTHDACFAYVLGLFPVLDMEIEGYFQSFLDWWGKMVDKMMMEPEIELKDEKLGFFGHADFWHLRLQNGRNTVLDLKTPVQYQKKWSLQLGGYWWLAKQAARVPLEPSVLMLDPDGGKAKLIWVEEQEKMKCDQLFSLFMQVLNIHKYFYLA